MAKIFVGFVGADGAIRVKRCAELLDIRILDAAATNNFVDRNRLKRAHIYPATATNTGRGA